MEHIVSFAINANQPVLPTFECLSLQDQLRNLMETGKSDGAAPLPQFYDEEKSPPSQVDPLFDIRVDKFKVLTLAQDTAETEHAHRLKAKELADATALEDARLLAEYKASLATTPPVTN